MSDLIYLPGSPLPPRTLVWLHGTVTSPPFSTSSRVEIGLLLRRLQRGESLAMPHSRAMPSIGARCHELRVVDGSASWRLVYRVDGDAVVIAEVFAKKTRATPTRIDEACRRRYRSYDRDGKGP
jgi:phage-related protein